MGTLKHNPRHKVFIASYPLSLPHSALPGGTIALSGNKIATVADICMDKKFICDKTNDSVLFIADLSDMPAYPAIYEIDRESMRFRMESKHTYYTTPGLPWHDTLVVHNSAVNPLNENLVKMGIFIGEAVHCWGIYDSDYGSAHYNVAFKKAAYAQESIMGKVLNLMRNGDSKGQE